MRILICGNGAREKYLAALCPTRGHATPDHGPWDVAVLPLPRSSLSEDVADQLPRGQKIVCGMTDAAFERLSENGAGSCCGYSKTKLITRKTGCSPPKGRCLPP